MSVAMRLGGAVGGGRRITSRLLVVLLAVIALAPMVPAHATKPLPRVSITGRILLGDAKSFHAVATVDRTKVFAAIPAIKTLLAEKVPHNTARYHFLIYEANREFQRAIATAARSLGTDLVVEQGGVSAAGIDVVDLTATAVAVFSKTERR